MKNALYIRDKDGNFVGIPAISGANGKSAYEQAVEGGYVGTEEDFIRALASLGGEYAIQLADNNAEYDEHIASKNNPHGVTAAQVGALSQAYYASADLNNEITQGGNKIIICCYFGNTLNSPHHHGLTYSSHGMVITNAYDPPFASQFCIPSGESRIFMRNNNGGNISEWLEIKKQNAYDVGALPIEGGVITGSVLGLGNGLAQIVGGPTYSSISAVSQNDYNNHRILRAINPDLTSYPLEKAVQIIDSRNGVPYEYNLFGDHNKPTKAYTGNGGSQTVQIGGLGIVAWLVSSNGLQGYVSKNGFMGMNSNGQASNQVASFITFENGVLTLNNGGLCNASGIEYTVQVL